MRFAVEEERLFKVRKLQSRIIQRVKFQKTQLRLAMHTKRQNKYVFNTR